MRTLAWWAYYLLALWVGTALLATSAVLSAIAGPAPRFKPRKPPEPAPGEWALVWNGTEAPWTLMPDNTHRQSWLGTEYRGSWHWDAGTRTLHVTETKDGVDWQGWSVKLCDELKGEGEFGTHRPTIALRRKPKQ